ncbi:TonB-dependent receptor [Microbulbifer halophilus]|uniref:TonB-dependent receptor domain-containing protein n=1 Tax=Microbulbifer halophilus TaxID=453963 RepID=A0ABW5ECV7_9GAMM|nr:TonB-dependent receptor [Microbulbifer halophilus]MCW8125990.1 TonB-dependent receptor [Microbulbifer halophilus]
MKRCLFPHAILSAAVISAMGTTPAAFAQETAAAIRGIVTGAGGQPVDNAKVIAIHEPSNSRREMTSGESGRFNLNGLRVGGPYTVRVESDQGEEVLDGIYLTLGSPLSLPVDLTEADIQVNDLEEVVVTAEAEVFSNSGSSSVFGEDQIEDAATFNRDLKDVVRSNPLAVVSPDGNQLSVAGSNPKYNSLTIDSVGINDTFGLQDNGYPTNRPPISLDAVEQISIDYAPFDARKGKFTGGNINVVTKSGTNEFHGSAYFESVPWAGTAKDDKLPDDGSVTEYDIENEEETYGVAFSGPLIQDKLFFFTSYEKWEEEVAFDYNLDTLANHDVTPDEASRVLGIMQDVYGLNDSVGSAPSPDEDEKLLVKLDWNISENHRADFTYSNQETSSARNYTNESETLNLASNLWTMAQDTTYYTSHLFSDWSDSFSTEVNLSYKEYEQASLTDSDWGEVNIRTANGYIVAGADQNRHANVLANEVWNFGVHGIYTSDYAQYRFGAELEDTWNYNLYGRHASGTWSFPSIDDFENRMANGFQYGNAYTNDIQDIAYDVDSKTYSLYGDVTLEPFTDFELVAGLRYETLSVGSAPNRNSNFEETYGYANTENLDGRDIWLPRVGFTWNLRNDLTLRGGVGRFSGGMPLVWVSNAYTNDGTTKDSVYFDSLNPGDVDFTGVPESAMDALAPGAGSTNNIDPDFELPSDWRYQLAADYAFDIPGVAEDFNWSTELTYVDREDAVYWRDLSRIDSGDRTPDGRVIWDNVYAGTEFEDNYDLELTNIDNGGRSVIWSTSLDKAFDNGVSFNLSYTHQDITEVNPGTSSTAESNYQYEVVENRNTPLEGTAYYEIEHRLVLNLGYRAEFVQDYATNFNLFVERRSGRPFSWTLDAYQDGDLGDQTNFDDSDVYLAYIPSGPNDPAVDFENGLSYEEVMEMARAAGVAGSAGGYTDKYSDTMPWVTTMDLAITQEVPGLLPDHRGLVYFTVDNFANLLNDDWGKVYDLEYPQQKLFDYDLNAEGQYVYDEPYGGLNSDNYSRFQTAESTWRVKLGLKYNF